MKLIKIILWMVFLTNCTSAQKNSISEMPAKSQDKQTKPIEKLKAKLPNKVEPLKGKFLDYAYLIRPDHKEPGYSINTFWLSDGYAYGEGPYDGYLIELFLFRGKDRDLVLEQISREGLAEGKDFTFGYEINPYIFTSNKMKKTTLSQVFPIQKMEKLYASQIEKMKLKEEFKNSEKEWNYFKLIRLPLKGTTIDLKVCREEGIYINNSPCALIGQLAWDKSKFNLKPVNTFEISKEIY